MHQEVRLNKIRTSMHVAFGHFVKKNMLALGKIEVKGPKKKL
jgi:hypothetical protein